MSLRNALKAVGAALAVIVFCAPMIFWPADNAGTEPTALAQATVTVPPLVAVATTLPPDETTTTTEAEEPTSTTTTTEPPLEITIAAVGDVLPHQSILDSAEQEDGRYDFWSIFAPVAPYIRAADYAVANLETRFAGPGPGYSGYPQFNTPDQLASVLKSSGFDMAATANNHALDQGWEGLVRTLDQLEAAGLKHVGTNRSLNEREKPVVVNVQGIDVAFLNYTESLNLAVPEEHQAYAVNMLDPDVVARDAALARMYGADIVIALLHYGIENRRYESEAQREVSEEILSRGVDVILGAHPHMVQPIDHLLLPTWKISDKYVAYSLGNFLSAQRIQYADSGVIAYVHITRKDLRTYVTGISYLPVYVQRSSSNDLVRYRILPVLPGSMPDTDVALTRSDTERMSAVWEETREQLYEPDENVVPLDPNKLGI